MKKNVSFEGINGNDKIKEFFKTHIEDSSLGHAYIFEGDVGTGKKFITKQILCAVACQSENAPCGKCDNCIKIQNDMCVDIFHIKREEGRSFIGVNSVRALYDTIGLVPNDLDFKAYVFEECEKMRFEAQNAFLKLLEEPPPNVFFFLLTSDKTKLLPTILSRTMLFNVQSLPAEAVVSLLKSSGYNENKARKAAEISKGSVGRAIEMLEAPSKKNQNDLSAYREKADGIIKIILDSKNLTKYKMIKYFKESFKTRDDIVNTYDCLCMALRDITVLKKCDNAALLYYNDDKNANDIYYSMTLEAIIKIFEAAQEFLLERDIPTNFNLTLAVNATRIYRAALD